jgi:hypothetical protein
MGRCIRVDFGTITGDLIKLTGSGAHVSEALGVAVEAPMEEVLLMGVALGVPGLTLASLADVLGLELWADSGLTAGLGLVMGELTAWWAGLRWVMTGEELTARWADITG